MAEWPGGAHQPMSEPFFRSHSKTEGPYFGDCGDWIRTLPSEAEVKAAAAAAMERVHHFREGGAGKRFTSCRQVYPRGWVAHFAE